MNLAGVFNKPIVLGVSFVALSFTTLQLAIILLIIMIFIDYVTGVLASYFEHKENGQKGNVWFTSQKTKLSILKVITYFLFILLTAGIQEVFKIKTFAFEKYADVEFSISLFAIAICVAIEFYSIFWENLPKAGFDIPKKIVSVYQSFKKLVLSIKGKNDESEVN